MPKSRHGHKRPHPQKRRVKSAPAVTRGQPATQTVQTAQTAQTAPKIAAMPHAAVAASLQYPFIATELKSIGIVTGIIAVILVILYFVIG